MLPLRRTEIGRVGRYRQASRGGQAGFVSQFAGVGHRKVRESYPSLGILQAYSEEYPNIRRTSRLEEVLTEDSIQAVAIATPAESHYVHVKEAILKGKNVFVEKPLALKYGQGRELVTLAKDRGVVLMVGHQ